MQKAAGKRKAAIGETYGACVARRYVDPVPAGIPLRVPVLLGLVVARCLGAGRAKRRTTSHPVGPVHTEAGGSGQKSQRRHVRTARGSPVPTGTAHSREGTAPLLWLPREAHRSRGFLVCGIRLRGGRGTGNTEGEHIPPPEAPTAGYTGSRRSHQRRSTYQRAHPFSRSPAGRAEGGADRDRLDQ